MCISSTMLTRLGTFDMSEIQIHLNRWTLPDNLRLRHGSYSVEWIIVGEGTFVYIPEPSSLVLLLASAVVAIPIGFRRTRRCNSRQGSGDHRYA